MTQDVAELYEVALRDRWGMALVLIAWLHFSIFATCQYLFGIGDRAESHFLPLWGVDLVGSVLIIRRFLVGPGKGPVPPLFGLLARVWVTFLILTFTSASLNKLVGFETDWFKAIWCTLSTFGFAMMAWIFHLRFLIPAVQMSLTGLLIARFPDYAYGIYAVSWCVALNVIGLTLDRRRVVVPIQEERKPIRTRVIISSGLEGLRTP